MGKKMLGKKMAAIFLPIHFSAPNVLAPKTSYWRWRTCEFLRLALQRAVDYFEAQRDDSSVAFVQPVQSDGSAEIFLCDCMATESGRTSS